MILLLAKSLSTTSTAHTTNYLRMCAAETHNNATLMVQSNVLVGLALASWHSLAKANTKKFSLKIQSTLQCQTFQLASADTVES